MPPEDTQTLDAPVTPPEPPAPPAPSATTFTAEDLEKARREERDKLYGRISKTDEKFKTLEEEISALREEREARVKAEAEARKAAEAAAKAKEEEEMELRALMLKRDQEWEAKFNTSQQDYDFKFAVLQKEREHLELKAYIQQRVAEERDNIEPHLVQFIQGNTKDEVEASIVTVKEASAGIFNDVTQGQQAVRQNTPGVSPNTGQPPSGAPLDTAGQPSGMTLEQLQAMPPGSPEYAEFRKQMGLDRNDWNPRSNQGMYA